MKTDLKGCSTGEKGSENYETFKHNGKIFYQYDYRHESGVLFSCVRKSLEQCRAALAVWLIQNNIK